MSNRPTLAFATMCKNEEHIIGTVLDAVAPYIDYLVVADNGSTDRTLEIVQEFMNKTGIPGEIHNDEWYGFDKNKNMMMEYVFGKTDYVLHLDADDILTGDFSFTFDDVGFDNYYMMMKRGTSTWKATVIYNNNFHWRFCGVAHTIIKCLEKPNGITSFGMTNRGFYISGEGIGSRAFDPKKYYHDAVKLEKQFWDTLIDDPDDLNMRSAFYTAQSYMDSDMPEEALKWNTMYMKLNGGWIEEKFEAQMRISLCMMKLNYSHDRIIQEMERAISMFPDRAEPNYHIGAFCNRIGRHQEAYTYLTKALSIDINKVKEKYILFVDQEAYGKNLYDELSVACFWTDRYQEGLNYLNQIIDDEKFSEHRERLLTNKRHFNDRLGIPNE